MALDLEIILKFMGIDPLVAWEWLRATHSGLFQDSLECEFSGDRCCIADVAWRIKNSGKPHFAVKWTGGSVYFGHVRNFDHSKVHMEHSVRDFTDALTWCTPFLTHPSFRQARVYDVDYDHWQNAEDPLEYTTVGRSYEDLPMKSNGLPPPLDQKVVDTSKNPGRRILHQGYVEAVSSLMWLGASFWSLTGASREQVRSAPWLKYDELPGQVVQIQVSNSPFVTAEGATGELQEKLRALLFPAGIKSRT